MSRNGSGVYSKPAGTTAVTNTTISSADYNSTIDDIAADLNLARPVVAGGTGATTAAGALVNLGLTATAAELNIMDGVVATTAQINRLVGITAAGQALIDDVDAAAQRTTLGLVIGTNVQAYDADLAALAGLAGVEGDIIYRNATQWQRLAKGTAGQFLRQNAALTAPEWTTQKFTSAEQTITANAKITLAHGLPSVPILWALKLKCLTAEQGYSIGDVIAVDLNGSTDSVTRITTLELDATNIVLHYSNTANVFSIPHKTTGVIAGSSNANWAAIVSAIC